MKAHRLSEPAIKELSLVFKTDPETGAEFAPRNREARVLGLKASEDKKTIFSKAVEAFESLKGYFAAFNDTPFPGFPVSTEVADTIDNDGDGADDYNAICGAICSVFYDLQQACGINDEDTRSAAVVTAIDSFLDGLDDLRGDDADKAGARHSAADKAHLDAIQSAHADAKKAVDAIGEHISALQPSGDDGYKAAVKALGLFVPGEVGEDGYPINMSNYLVLAEKAKKKDEPPKPYGDVEYADPENGKYPIDTEEHARAAWSYINQEKNSAEYSADKLAKVKDKIRAACKRFGIEISEDSGKAAEVEMKPEEVQSMIAEALKAKDAESTATIESAKAEAQTKIDAANAEAEAAKAREAAAVLKADEAAAEAARVKAEAVKEARTASATSASGVKTVKASEKLLAACKAALGSSETPVI